MFMKYDLNENLIMDLIKNGSHTGEREQIGYYRFSRNELVKFYVNVYIKNKYPHLSFLFAYTIRDNEEEQVIYRAESYCSLPEDTMESFKTTLYEQFGTYLDILIELNHSKISDEMKYIFQCMYHNDLFNVDECFVERVSDKYHYISWLALHPSTMESFVVVNLIYDVKENRIETRSSVLLKENDFKSLLVKNLHYLLDENKNYYIFNRINNLVDDDMSRGKIYFKGFMNEEILRKYLTSILLKVI